MPTMLSPMSREYSAYRCLVALWALTVLTCATGFMVMWGAVSLWPPHDQIVAALVNIVAVLASMTFATYAIGRWR